MKKFFLGVLLVTFMRERDGLHQFIFEFRAGSDTLSQTYTVIYCKHLPDISADTLAFNDGIADIATLTIPDATYTTNGEGVLYVAVPSFSSKDITLTATVGSDTYTFEKASTTLTNGQYYILTI